MTAAISLDRIGIRPQDAPPVRRADRYEFVILVEGSAEFFFAGHSRSIEAGCAVAVLPGESRAISGNGKAEAAAAIISFDADWAAAAHRRPLVEAVSSLPPSTRAIRELGTDAMASLDRKQHDAFSVGTGIRDGFRESLLESIFIDLSLEFLRPNDDRRGERAPIWLRKACSAMERDKNLRCGCSRLAELAGKSPEHVIRQMKRYYDMTPTRFVNELRLRKASKLLIESATPVLDISYSLGFENPSYFSQLFKEKYGMPPTRFRAGRRR